MGNPLLLAVAVVVALASPGWAAEGEYTGIACGSAKSTILESSPELTVMTTETWAIQTPLSRFLDERIFGPLRMTDTAFRVPAAKVTRIAQPLAIDRTTGKPITLHDVTVAPANDAGGAGAAGTATDDLRFLKMMANGGQLNRQRLLARTIVRHMTSDHLGDIKPATTTLPPGYGFGPGFAVRREDGLNGAPGSAGEYNWAGAGGTAFWVDPKGNLLMTQTQPGPWQREFKVLFRQLVYQAIVD